MSSLISVSEGTKTYVKINKIFIMEYLAVLFYFPDDLTASSTAVALILTPCSSQGAKYTAMYSNYW